MLAELVDVNTRAFMAANTKRGTSLPKPLEIKRPTAGGVEPAPKKKRPATSAELAAYFGAGSVRYTGGAGGTDVRQAATEGALPACGRCGAAEGEGCTTKAGSPARRAHAGRAAGPALVVVEP